MSTDLFERASRRKLRFETAFGLLTPEDLWGVRMTTRGAALGLNELAKKVNRELKELEEEDFVTTSKPTVALEDARLRLEIIKRVIEVRQAEAEERAEAVKRRKQKERILEIIEDKEDEELLGKSKEELLKLARDL